MFCVLIIAIPTGMRWYLIVVLICISLMFTDAELPFVYLLAICAISLEKCLSKSFTYFKNQVIYLFIHIFAIEC
jgi:hypothetical protein